MNKTAIRNFAIWARNKLIADVSYKAGLMGITSEGISDALSQSTLDVEFYDIGTAEPYAIRAEEIKQRKGLVDIIRQKEKESDYATAYSSVIEEVAYTWFNRLIAVRFMEINDYMPAHIRVLSSETGKLEPDIVTTPFDAELELTDVEKQQIIELKNDNKLDECFRMLFIKQCNALHSMLPRLFENTSDYSELLLNVSFVDQDGVIYHLVHDIEEDDFNIEKGGQVEIIGWLYQYYNSELKDETFALLKNNVKVTKERIPSATQLFTPDWIVRYMVENSLGRLWIEGHPNDTLKSGWKYYLDEAEQEADVQEKLDEIHAEYAKLTPEDIKVIDPCMGSGHILVYAFDVLMQIYESVGYNQRDAAKSILENNLFGLDIDERAAQLAYFAVLMKARQYNRRILNDYVTCNVYAIRESNGIDRDALNILGEAKNIGEKLVDTFIDAKEYGSILKVDITADELVLLDSKLDELKNKTSFSDVFEAANSDIVFDRIVPLLLQAKLMLWKYDAVITNPPYLANGNMNQKTLDYVKDNYPDTKSDLFSVFVERCIAMSKVARYQGFMTSYTWMYIATFESFRKMLLEGNSIISLVQPEYHAFFESANVPICTFITHNGLKKEKGTYIKLSDFYGADIQPKKLLEAINDDNCSYKFYSSAREFTSIPGEPIAYWTGKRMIEAFQSGIPFGKVVEAKQGLATADNNRFLRMWFEPQAQNVKYDAASEKEALESNCKWFPYNKGGDFRKWYGNNDYVVNWYNDGAEIKDFKDNKGKQKSRPQNLRYYFRPSVTWTLLSSSATAFRYRFQGSIFDINGMSFFASDEVLKIMLAFSNSKVMMEILKITAPTLSFQIGDVSKSPILPQVLENKDVAEISNHNINLEKEDWDSFETSWDFKRHPLI